MRCIAASTWLDRPTPDASTRASSLPHFGAITGRRQLGAFLLLLVLPHEVFHLVRVRVRVRARARVRVRVRVRETGVVVLEVGVPDTGRIGTVVLEVGVPDTGRIGTVGAGRVGTRAEGVGGEQEWRTWTVAVAGLGGETWISRM